MWKPMIMEERVTNPVVPILKHFEKHVFFGWGK